MAEAISDCAALVRRVDYDRYLTALFAPPPARERLFALYAFNHEIAKVRETVSEPMIGQIRLQWWREAIGGIYAGAPRKHMVVAALAEAVAASPPQRADFEALIDAREFDLEGRAPRNLAELEAYAEGSSSRLLYLAAALLGARGEATRAALRPLGVAWSLVGLIRAIPFHARARRHYIPADVAQDAGLTDEAVFALQRGEPLRRAVAALAEAAARHLTAARSAKPEKQARPLLLYAPLARAYLRSIEARRHDVVGRPPGLAPVSKILRLWWAARSGAG